MNKKKYLNLTLRGFFLMFVIAGGVFLFNGCSKTGTDEVPNTEIISSSEIYNLQEYPGKAIDVSIEEKRIINVDEFKKQMRETNRTVSIDKFIMPKRLTNIMSKMDIAETANVCFGDIDCKKEGEVCLTLCQVILEDYVSDIKVCQVEKFINDPNVNLINGIGVCGIWKMV